MPPHLTLVKSLHYRVRLSTKTGDYVYDSSRGIVRLSSGIEMNVTPEEGQRLIRATVRYMKKHGLPYNYSVEQIDHDDDRKPCDV